ncbi:DNA/RNA helicase domain-containing protein [Vibrio lentus]|uniref:DNA/RNA helicase domain-containing protein n=1 Tax=Vibrio lentus TaxID=136468 RepID=UPI002D1FB7F5|nr:DNA/RNA helicase domain-containing protein [Vibrio lentus]
MKLALLRRPRLILRRRFASHTELGLLVLSEYNRHRRQYDHYTEGSYRVLLSRGRSGLVIKCDDGETFGYLKSCGMQVV